MVYSSLYLVHKMAHTHRIHVCLWAKSYLRTNMYIQIDTPMLVCIGMPICMLLFAPDLLQTLFCPNLDQIG